MADPAVVVVENPDRERYEITVDGELAGYAQYVRRGGRTLFVHTEVDRAFEGRGLGSQLAEFALDAERTAQRPIVPLCPFIRSYVERHPEYAGLVDTDLLHRIDPA
jgi:predicted GNAT family acetyltransferase